MEVQVILSNIVEVQVILSILSIRILKLTRNLLLLSSLDFNKNLTVESTFFVDYDYIYFVFAE